MIIKRKPTSPGRRGQTQLKGRSSSKNSLTKSVLRSLSTSLNGTVGRDHGQITVFQKRRGAKKRYRIVDFKRDKYDVPGVVESIEYDPNRACEIALVLYVDGERRFIIAPGEVNVGDKVISGENVAIKPGNALPMSRIPLGLPIHNIELYPKAGGKFVRSAGTSAQITAKEGNYVNVRMPSGEVRRFLADGYATVGTVGNEEWKLVKLGKAGRLFHMGKRPHIRGKARSDSHPHAGSYRRRVGRHPVDKYGNLAKGGRTRTRKNTNKYIITKRKGRR